MPKLTGSDENPGWKIVLLGDAAVGKSSLVTRLSKGVFDPAQDATIGGAFTKHAMVINKLTVSLDIWDTGGSERFRSMVPLYYRGMYGAIICFDITDRNSYDGGDGKGGAVSWIRELREYSEIDADMPIILTGTKADMKMRRQVEMEDAVTFADDHDLFYMETSAKQNINVGALFEHIATKLLEKHGKPPAAEKKLSRPERKKSSCC